MQEKAVQVKSYARDEISKIRQYQGHYAVQHDSVSYGLGFGVPV